MKMRVLSFKLIAVAQLIVATILAILASQNLGQRVVSRNKCHYQLVESTPDDLDLEEFPGIAKTHEVFLNLINNASKSIQITSFQFSLLPLSPDQIDHPSTKPGQLVLEALEKASHDRKVKVEIIYGLVNSTSSKELQRMTDAGIEFKYFNVTKLMGRGVQHSKFMITDHKNFYLGSANMDWRAFTQVKEFGIVYRNCRTLASDLSKIFETYSLVLKQERLPKTLPEDLISTINKQSPLSIGKDGIISDVYFGVSPPRFFGLSTERSNDIDVVLDTIASAKKFVYVSFMSYSPLYFGKKGYWPVIENALKSAVYMNKVEVKILISKSYKKFRANELKWYKSLNALRDNSSRGGVEVQVFSVPSVDAFQASLPYARLKHDKYIVTENCVYIGTSNLAPDYFISSTGVGISITPDEEEMKKSDDNIVARTKALFERDFYSKFSNNIDDFDN